MMKYLDEQGLKHFKERLDLSFNGKLNAIIQSKSYNDWLALNDTVPASGTILVYTDRTNVNGANVPDIKIANGTNTVAELPFLSDRTIDELVAEYISIVDGTNEELMLVGTSDNSSNTIKSNSKIKIKDGTIIADNFDGTAKKVSHAIKIGNYSYDGSADLEIPIYKGENSWH